MSNVKNVKKKLMFVSSIQTCNSNNILELAEGIISYQEN